MKIHNRRYIGSKTKLLDSIYNNVMQLGYDKSNTFCDIFAGTGVVANKFAENGYQTIINDNLYSNAVVYHAFLGEGKIDYDKINNIIKQYNAIDAYKLQDNYFSNVYANKYFEISDAKKIGFIRDDIENIKDKLSFREYCYLLTSLMYATDRIANTVGHFESFLNKNPEHKNVFLENLEINEKIKPAIVYNEDANKLIKKIDADILYIDPPYNARQYVNFYHVLENLVRWNKPIEFEGNSMKFKRDDLKSGYCRENTAKLLFQDLINSSKSKLIVVSYNNTYKAKSTSSNNTIQSEDIIKILSQKGNVIIREINYRPFNAGKTDLLGHKEILYICEVKK